MKENIIPELPEVETARRQLTNLEGFKVSKVIVRDNNGKTIKLRKPVPANELKFLVGKTLLEVKRRSKYLFLIFEEYVLVCHFGMTGMLFDSSCTKHEIIRLENKSGKYISYCDTRKFGMLDVVKRSNLKAYLANIGLGFEPLGKSITVGAVEELLKGSNKPIKEWLLDQSKITGIGNIYASEILYATKIHPLEKACNCVAKAGKMLAATIKILSLAIENGGSTINSYSSPDGKMGNAQSNHKVYARDGKPCYRCKSTIIKLVHGRSSFYCELCQKLHN